MQKNHLTIHIYGIVQNVNFRWSVKHLAEGLGITGYVNNNTDHSVTVEAEGASDDLHDLVQWCQTGPSRATVVRLETESGHLHYHTDFQIR